MFTCLSYKGSICHRGIKNKTLNNNDYTFNSTLKNIKPYAALKVRSDFELSTQQLLGFFELIDEHLPAPCHITDPVLQPVCTTYAHFPDQAGEIQHRAAANCLPSCFPVPSLH